MESTEGPKQVKVLPAPVYRDERGRGMGEVWVRYGRGMGEVWMREDEGWVRYGCVVVIRGDEGWM